MLSSSIRRAILEKSASRFFLVRSFSSDTHAHKNDSHGHDDHGDDHGHDHGHHVEKADPNTKFIAP